MALAAGLVLGALALLLGGGRGGGGDPPEDAGEAVEVPVSTPSVRSPAVGCSEGLGNVVWAATVSASYAEGVQLINYTWGSDDPRSWFLVEVYTQYVADVGRYGPPQASALMYDAVSDWCVAHAVEYDF